MKKNENLTLTIEDVAFGGAGVGRHEKQVIFVPNTLPGEKVEVSIVEKKKKFSNARVTKILKASPKRIDPKCEYFESCQGCAYQHTDYSNQLDLKKKQVIDLFQRIGKLTTFPEIKTIASDTHFGFRNKIKIHAEKKGTEWKAGFIGEDNRQIINIETCAIAHPKINERLKVFREGASKEQDDFRGTWVARVNSKEVEKDFFFEREEERKVALPLIKDQIAGKAFLSPFDSFFQTNHEMLEKLVEEVKDKLDLKPNSTFIDAYCGVGLFTLLFAPDVKKSIGIEYDFRAIGCAKKNNQILHIKNSAFVQGKVEEKLAEVLEKNKENSPVLLLDPPRRGCDAKVLETIVKNKIDKLIYVSCNPATLARDLSKLNQEGYTLKEVTLLDMFPQTAHMELVCLIDRA